MSSDILPAFDCLRLPYKGPHDTIKCVEVDVSGNRLYAACNSGGVFVWELESHKPLSLLRHPLWVNAVRCYPPVQNNSATNALIESRHNLKAASRGNTVGKGNDQVDGIPENCAEDAVISCVMRGCYTEVVLTGCEDGVVSAWNPMTFRIKTQCRLSEGPVTHLHLPPLPSSLNPAAAAGGAASVFYVVSMHNVFAVQLKPEMTMLRCMENPTICLAITSITTPRNQCLLVGQENGAIVCWSLTDYSYDDTLAYPTGEADIDADARETDVIHVPRYNDTTGMAENTFAYNIHRCANRGHSGYRQNISAEEETARYHVHMLAEPVLLRNSSDSVTAATKAGIVPPLSIQELEAAEREAKTAYIGQYESPVDNEAERNRMSPTPTPEDGGEAMPGPQEPPAQHTASAATLMYDRRRVTCLAAGREESRVSYRFYSGHATGELLIWEASYRDQPTVLLKKIQIFPSTTWVWNLLALEGFFSETKANAGVSLPSISLSMNGVAASSSSLAARKDSKGVPSLMNLKPPQTAAAVITDASRKRFDGAAGKTRLSYLQLIAWADSGEVRYIYPRKRVHMCKGPGFLATAATHWHGYEIRASLLVNGDAEQQEIIGTSSSKNKMEKDDKSSDKLAPLPFQVKKNNDAPITHTKRHYVIMANFEGRIERFDVTPPVTKLLHMSSGT